MDFTNDIQKSSTVWDNIAPLSIFRRLNSDHTEIWAKIMMLGARDWVWAFF